MPTLQPFEYEKLYHGTKCQLRNGDIAYILHKSADPLVSHYAIVGLHQFANSTKQAPISWDKDGKWADVQDETCRKFDIVSIYPSKNPTENNGWISTKDKMPEQFEMVLIFWETESESEKERQDVACWAERYNSWLATEFAIPLNIRPEQVTHWQPLPEPPAP